MLFILQMDSFYGFCCNIVQVQNTDKKYGDQTYFNLNFLVT